MAQNIKLNATVVGEITVGANPQPANTLTFTIENQGDPIESSARVPPMLYLKGRVGSDPAALFARKEDARDSCIATVPDGWASEWWFPSQDVFVLKLYTYNEVMFDRGAKICITLSPVISQTAPGQTAVSFSSDLPIQTQPLSVVKTAKQPDIIYFISDPESGVMNLPNSSVTLRWRTYQLGRRELTQVGAGLVPGVQFGNQDEGSKSINCGTSDTMFRLKGYPLDGSQPIDCELTVRVLQPGWYDRTVTLFEGDPGYAQSAGKRIDLEPTLLLNANNQCLYGVFRYFDARDKEQALLFQTTHPFAPWSLVATSVANQSGAIPEGFSTSPGVYFDDKLWLIGGSQIDPDIVANRVWCLDPKQNVWQDCGPAEWAPRMGHAVLVFGNQIWVMGGRDQAGNARNDVWRFDIATRKWTALGNAPWAPRCLFSPAVFQGQIWLYGGALEPFSARLYDDFYVYQDGSWAKRDLTGIIAANASRKPIASCLQEFRFGDGSSRLCLFGKFRTVSSVDGSETTDSLAFSLSTPSTRTWDNFPSDGLQDWGADTTFSYRLLNYRDRMLIASALGYDRSNTVLKIYVRG